MTQNPDETITVTVINKSPIFSARTANGALFEIGADGTVTYRRAGRKKIITVKAPTDLIEALRAKYDVLAVMSKCEHCNEELK